MTSDEYLSHEEVASMLASLDAIERGQVEFISLAAVMGTLRELWSTSEISIGALGEARARYILDSADWFIGMSPEFRKATSRIDRKLQGRIFQALSAISREPTTPKGNTIKALTSDFKGFWRYRIGDSRLIYYPDTDTRQVTLVTFSPRGDAYGN